MDEQNQQTNSYELKQQQKLKEQAVARRKKVTKKWVKIILVISVIALPVVGLIWYAATRPPTPESDIVSKKGLHWHPELTITIKGQKQEIPANIGIGAVHQPIHTHDATGTLHLEIQGLVTKEDIKLGKFFKIWGKQFNSECIFDSCDSPSGKLKMFVNGKENNEFDNYLMQDKDKIEIIYNK